MSWEVLFISHSLQKGDSKLGKKVHKASHYSQCYNSKRTKLVRKILRSQKKCKSSSMQNFPAWVHRTFWRQLTSLLQEWEQELTSFLSLFRIVPGPDSPYLTFLLTLLWVIVILIISGQSLSNTKLWSSVSLSGQVVPTSFINSRSEEICAIFPVQVYPFALNGWLFSVWLYT